MELSSLKRDSEAISTGQWVGDIPGMGTLCLKVRGITSPVVTALRSRKERNVPIDKRERDGAIKPETAALIMGEVIHEAVLLDWDGLDDGGKPVKYNNDLAFTLLTDPDFRNFADAVAYAAQVVDRGRSAADEELVKNSEGLSDGRSKEEKTQTT